MIAPTESFFYEFDEFRVDPLKRRLSRSGEIVPLTPKAFSILLVLLENRGEVVEKRDLVAQVWPDTHVSDANLTQNVSALRKALGERAGEGRYIVTVPGRGYRFTADVALLEKVPTGSFSQPDLRAAPSLEETQSRAPEPGLLPEPPRADRVRRRLRPPPAVLLALGLALAAISLIFLQRLWSPAPASVEADSVAPDRRAIAVLGFSNLSPDGPADWLAPVLTEMLTTELAAGARMRVVSLEKVEQVRQSLPPRAPDIPAGLDPEWLHSRLGADLVVVGSYLSLPAGKGRRLRLDVRVRRLPSGDTAAVLSQVGDEAALPELVYRSGVQLRQALGEGEGPGRLRQR